MTTAGAPPGLIVAEPTMTALPVRVAVSGRPPAVKMKIPLEGGESLFELRESPLGTRVDAGPGFDASPDDPE